MQQQGSLVACLMRSRTLNIPMADWGLKERSDTGIVEGVT